MRIKYNERTYNLTKKEIAISLIKRAGYDASLKGLEELKINPTYEKEIQQTIDDLKNKDAEFYRSYVPHEKIVEIVSEQIHILTIKSIEDLLEKTENAIKKEKLEPKNKKAKQDLENYLIFFEITHYEHNPTNEESASYKEAQD